MFRKLPLNRCGRTTDENKQQARAAGRSGGMKKGRKRKISVVNTTSNTLVATFGSEGDTKSFSQLLNHQQERIRDEPEAETRKEVGPGDQGPGNDEAKRGSVPGETRWRGNDRGKSSATTTKRPSPESAATTTKHPSPKSAATASSKSATGHRGHPGRRPEAGGRHSHEQYEQTNQTNRRSPGELENIASSTAGHNGKFLGIN